VKDPIKFGQELFLAGETDLNAASVDTLFNRDFKDFDMNGIKVGVGQLEVYSSNLLKERNGEFLNEMKKMQKEQGYQDLIFLFTDIQSEGTELLVIGKIEDANGKAFKVSLSNNSAWVVGLMS
jgi:manganese-dependent inorganic pyrophosphatase